MSTEPLLDKTILITRSEKQGSSFAEQVKKLGGTPIVLPLISFKPAHLSMEEQNLLSNLSEFDWIIFTSANGVEYFFEYYKTLESDSSIQSKLAVVGEKTKEVLEKKGYHASLIPKEYVAEGLVKDFETIGIKNQKILYVKSNLSRDFIPTMLKKLGADLFEVTLYETYCPLDSHELLKIMRSKVDIITFTSPSTIKHFVHLLKGAEWLEWINSKVVCCIGPITEKAAKDYGIVPTITPHTYTMDSLLEEIISFYQKKEEKI